MGDRDTGPEMAAATRRLLPSWLHPVVPDRQPLLEQDDFARAVLSKRRPGPFVSAVAAFAAHAFVPVTVVGLVLLIGATLSDHTTSALVVLGVTVLLDWVSSVTGANVVRILDLAGAHARMRAIARGLLIAALLAESASADQTTVVMSYVGVLILLQVCWLVYYGGAGWLAKRQPPLLVATRGRQPEITVDYAIAYSRGTGVSGLLLALDYIAVVGIVAADTWGGTSPGNGALVVAGAVAACVVIAGAHAGWVVLRLGSDEIVERSERDLVARLEQAHPKSVVYISAGVGQAQYILGQWIDSLEAMSDPCVVIVREGTQLTTIRPTPLPVVYAPNTRHVEVLVVPGVRLAFYLANAGKNVHLLREVRIKHVFLNHGDSDKSTSANPVSRVYDEVWVAGEAAIHRYQAAGIEIREDNFAIVGRPQVEMLHVGPINGDRTTVLYAPTFEGYYEESNYSSLEVMGPAMVEWLLSHQPDMRVIFKPHPASGVQRPGMRTAIDSIEAMLRAAPGGVGHVIAEDDPDLDLTACFASADLLISDVSSVVTDFLQTERPIISSNPKALPIDMFYESFPTLRPTYVVGPDLAQFPAAMSDALGADPLAPARKSMKTYVLGDLEHGPLRAFLANVDRLQAVADADLALIRNDFRVKSVDTLHQAS